MDTITELYKKLIGSDKEKELYADSQNVLSLLR